MFTSDFRSDTVTKPTAAMRAALAEAEVGDDVLDGDPSVRELEAYAADWLGKEGALFVPSGTMANQIAVGAHVRAGDEVILEETAHILLYEAGGLGYLHGVQTLTLASDRGMLDPQEVERKIRPDYIHCPRTSLVCVEQTHMAAGGRVLPLEELQALAAVARERGVFLHMDGARLANAVVASGIPAHEWASVADSVSVCLSKGLGAPIGSMVAGDGEFFEKARVLRKRLGGWMRQAGGIAAAGLIGLRDGLERLADDHRLAEELRAACAELDGLSAPESVETNLVSVKIDHPELDGPKLAAHLADDGVGVLALERDAIRFVTHRDVDSADVERTAVSLQRALR